MPTFLKKLAKDRPWSEEELATLRVESPSRFITVTESHAAQVLRPQGWYQEVPDEEANDIPRPVAESVPKASTGRRPRSSSKGGGGDRSNGSKASK